jgi:hypothetical protein
MPRKRASQKTKSQDVFGPSRKQPKMLRAGLYARVSTNDQQTLAMQNRAMREYAARRGWTIALQVREVNSGAAKREAREKVLEAARRREIDVVLVWRLDRRSPEFLAVLSGLGQASPGSFLQNLPFEGGENGQHCSHRTPGRGRQIQRLGQRYETHAEIFQLVKSGQQIRYGSAPTISG